MGKINKRMLISVVSLLLVVLVIFLAREQLIKAWHLLSSVNVWILLLLIPVQLLSYYASGEIIFAYLQKQYQHKLTSRFDMTKMALEFNFVNHILPSGGVSGASYMTWRLKMIGVSGGRATLALFVRFAMGFAGFLALLAFALIFMAFDGSINRLILLASGALGTAITLLTFFTIYVIGSKMRLKAVSHSVAKFINLVMRKLRIKSVIKEDMVVGFLTDLHQDYLVLRRAPRMLWLPFIWGVLVSVFDVAMFMVVFWALGVWVNPALLFVAYGLAVAVGSVLTTPGGAGGYEAVMILFLVTAGVPEGIVVAGIVLTRALLILGTVVTGYVFYQLAITKYGKRPLNG